MGRSRLIWKRSLDRFRGKSDVEGLVFNVQKFSIHDGPGIRTTVFLKGCPLHCPWCSNPESINHFPEVITKFDVLCTDCGRCQDVCAAGAIKVSEPFRSGEGLPQERTRFLDRDLCDRCMACVEVCTSGALSGVGESKTVEEVMDVVEQDRPFYNTSGGGMTLSGGEPLAQPGFTLALLEEGRRRGLHTVLDTCGHATREVIASLLPYLDLVLYDVKHTDPEVHRRTLGADNRAIMDNLRFINGRVPIWLRVPLIPGFNDDDDSLGELVALARDISPPRLYFLPYHRWGSGKYKGLGREYALEDAGDIPASRLEMIERLCRDAGIADFRISSE